MKINNQSGFTALEGLVVLIVIAVIGFGGYYVWNKNYVHKVKVADTTPSSNNSNSNVTPVKAYHRTTTVPAAWKTYANNKYYFSTAYPNGWYTKFSVTNDKNYIVNDTVWSKNATTMASTCYAPATATQSCNATLIIVNQTLEDTVSQAKKNYYDTQVKNTIKKNITYDGHPAVEFTYDNATAKNMDIYVGAHGYTYALPTVWFVDNGSPVNGSAKQSLQLTESVKIN